jgi:membrane-bound lytic murein transglycosylase D
MNAAGQQPGLPTLLVTVGHSAADRQDFRFCTPFRIGRAEDCELRIQDQYVSRYNAAVTFAEGQWWIRDLGSSNGLLIGDQRVTAAPISPSVMVRLGAGGPFVALRLESPPPPVVQPNADPASAPVVDKSVDEYVERYFSADPLDENAGAHTRMIRLAFQNVQKKQRRRYTGVFVALGIALLAVGAFGFYQYRQASKQREMAQDIFYSMKALDVDIGNVEKIVAGANNPQASEQVQKSRDRRKDLEKSYDRFLSTLHVYDPKMTEQDRLVLRVARIFGECELAMPPGFKDEVQNYIKKWQSSGRFAKAIASARQNGYTTKISEEFLAQDLPPQFFYLALQESSFDPYISGPPTYKGIAKGMWQFIPETGMKYGLRIGPLAEFRRPDPADDRHHWEKATKAAASYIKDIYTTDAQASGLLVMASYNWGEDKVIRIIRSMPANPRERNFWKLLSLSRDKLPNETYDYVFYIVSAAVIGENPRLFGFDFDNPLGHLESK